MAIRKKAAGASTTAAPVPMLSLDDTLAERVVGMSVSQAKTIASAGIHTLEDLRDADINIILESLPESKLSLAHKWQKQALLQTVFPGLGPKQASRLVRAGVESIPSMAQVDTELANGRIKETHLRAWKFIAGYLPVNILPERLETTEGVVSLLPTQAVALYAQAIQDLPGLCGAEAEQLDFSLLPTINKQKIVLWKRLAGLRLEYEIGPTYAWELHHLYSGNRAKIHQHVQCEKRRVLARLPRSEAVRARGWSTSSSAAATIVSDRHLPALCEELAVAVSRGEKRNTTVNLRKAKKWGSASDIAARLLQETGNNSELDTSKIVSWVSQNQLTSRRGLLDLVSGFVPNKEGQKDLLGTLANQFGLGTLLSDISKSSDRDALLSLVTKVTSRWQDLLLELPKLGSAAAQIVEKIAAEKNVKPADLIAAVLQSGKHQKESALQTLVSSLQEKQFLEMGSTVLDLYEKYQVGFIQPFLTSFLNVEKTTAKIDELFDLPVKLFGKESNEDRRNVFTAIFRAVTEFSAEKNDFHGMMSGLAVWLRQMDHENLVPVVDNRMSQAGPDGVPVQVYLLGEGVKSYLDEDGGNHHTVEKFAEKLLDYLPPQADALEEEIWMHLAKIPPLLFVLLPKMLVRAISEPMKVFQWIGQDANRIVQSDRKLEILTLPPPDKEHKYVILSDVHRDAPEDLVDEFFFDLSHFSKNRDLFIKALEYYADNGYVVIENGDCEELWVVPSVKNNKGVRARAANIISPDGPHRRVYAILSDLHKQGRYFRTRGNHDDFWAHAPENLSLLKETWFREGPVEFKVWDALIIPDVLTMKDGHLKILRRIFKAQREKKPIPLDELLDLFPVGLSPHRYRERKPLFILHGHQTDFWNCDEHSFLGKILANSLGIIADGMTTFPYHLRGIDFAGKPILEFDDVLLDIPQVNNWLPSGPALRLSRRIEQSVHEDRTLQDGITYSESFTASLALALKYPGQSGLQQIQILVGHTHWPQSRPHLNLCTVGLPSIKRKATINLSTSYYNSGTCGWWEGVLWGIEVTDFGQPKLFYWEKNANVPHYMPWELHDQEPEQLVVFKNKIKDVLDKFLTPSVLEHGTDNLATWEDVDDFSKLRRINLSALEAEQQTAALKTAHIWALRRLDNRPKTSQSLEIILNLENLLDKPSLPKRFESLSLPDLNPKILMYMLRTIGIGEKWVVLKPGDKRYHHVGSFFFYASFILRNSICSQIAQLINVFISKEAAYMTRYTQAQQNFFLKFGTAEGQT